MLLFLLLLVEGRLLQRDGEAVGRHTLEVEAGDARVGVHVESGREGLRVEAGGWGVIVGRGAKPTGALWSSYIGDGSSALHSWMQARKVDLGHGAQCQLMPVESADPMRLCTATERSQTGQSSLVAVLDHIQVKSETIESIMSTLECTSSCSPYRISVVPPRSASDLVFLEMDTGILLRFLILFLSILGSIVQSMPALVPAPPNFVRAMGAYEQYNHHGVWYVTRNGDRQPPLGDICFPVDRIESLARRRLARQVLPDCVELSLDDFVERMRAMGDVDEKVHLIGRGAIKKAFRMPPPDDSAVLLYDISKSRLQDETRYLTRLKELGLPVIEFSTSIIEMKIGYAYAARYIPHAILVKVTREENEVYDAYLETMMGTAARLGRRQREALDRDLEIVIQFIRINTIDDLQGLIHPDTGRFYLTDPLGIHIGEPTDYHRLHILRELQARIRDQ